MMDQDLLRTALLALGLAVALGGPAGAQSNPLMGRDAAVVHGRSAAQPRQDLNSATGMGQAPTTRTHELRQRSQREAAAQRRQTRGLPAPRSAQRTPRPDTAAAPQQDATRAMPAAATPAVPPAAAN